MLRSFISFSSFLQISSADRKLYSSASLRLVGDNSLVEDLRIHHFTTSYIILRSDSSVGRATRS